jgi:hypothetical protein
MDHPQNDCHLHLVGVREHQAIVRTMPAWIQTKGINMTIGFTNDSPGAFWEVPPGVPDVKGFGEYVIVNEAGVYRK